MSELTERELRGAIDKAALKADESLDPVRGGPQAALLLTYWCDDMRAVLDLHRPWRIYDECDHSHGEETPGVVNTGDFFTCAAAYLYSICQGCCCDDPNWLEQSERCVDRHAHHQDQAWCPTVGVMITRLTKLGVLPWAG